MGLGTAATRASKKSPGKRKVVEGENVEVETPKKTVKTAATPGKEDNNGQATPSNNKQHKTKRGKSSTEPDAEETDKKRQESAKLALDYLNSWQNDKASWKFNKNLQGWLLKNLFQLKQLSNENFETALKYFEMSRGNVRNVITTQCLAKIEASENKKEDEMTEEVSEVLDRANRLMKMKAFATVNKENKKLKKKQSVGKSVESKDEDKVEEGSDNEDEDE